jgi:hypothetical protein
MTTPSIPDPERVTSLVPVAPAKGAAARRAEVEPSVAFRALLDALQEKASTLAQTSASVDDPNRLAGAVEAARETLDQAVTLSDRLLESWRAERQRARDAGEGGSSRADERP